MSTRAPDCLLLCLGLALAAPGAASPAPYPTPEHTREEFEAVCRRLTEGDNPFFGRAGLLRFERLLGDTEDAAQRVALLTRAGIELLRLDRLEESVERLETALGLAAELPAEEARSARSFLLEILGLVHLQSAENQNCLGMRTPASCILPIGEEGVHRHPEAARRAGDSFQGALELAPRDVGARWLLNLARMLEGAYPGGVPPELRLPEGALEPEAPMTPWTDIGGALGIAAVDLSGGAVMDDFDGDGILDLVSSSWDPCEPLKAFRGDGRGGFEDVSRRWGLDAQLGGLNLMHADYDGDGALDLLVLRGGWLGEDGLMRNSLLRNDLRGENGRFVDATFAAGLAYPAYPTQTAAWADYDGDGDLDLYVGNESPIQSTRPTTLTGRTGRPYPSQLFRNEGPGDGEVTFTDVSREAGVQNFRFAKGVAWGDYDGDGAQDLYVSNIGPNRLYRNRGDGRFADVAPEAGVVEPARASFATWFFDYDQDGDLDLYVGRYDARVEAVLGSYLGLPAGGPTAEGVPVIHRNDGGGRFTDVSEALGLRRPTLPMGANFGDLDNDGFPDFVLGTGVPDYDAVMPDVVYRNEGGRRFRDVTFASGLAQIQKGHGVAFGDFDRDGDQDLFRQLGGAYPGDTAPNALYENPGSDHAWIAVELAGARADRSGVGARIEARVRRGEEARSLFAWAGSGGSFGGSSFVQEMGLGPADELLALTVSWPGHGDRQRFEGLPLRRYYRVE